MTSICIITPCYKKDIERFSMLRESINQYGKEFEQVAIVHSEDLALFQNRFKNEPKLKFIPTNNVLPKKIEKLRLFRQSDYKYLNSFKKRVLAKKYFQRSMSGWHTQQLTKLYGLAQCDYDSAIYLDSDVFLCDYLSPNDFFIDGKLKLYRRKALEGESLDFAITTYDLLDEPLQKVFNFYDHIYQPCCFQKSTAKAILALLNDKRGDKWLREFGQERRPAEFNLLGYAAEHLEGFSGYHIVDCQPTDLHHSIRYKNDVDIIENELEKITNENKNFFLIQSNLNLPDDAVRNIFNRAIKINAKKS